MAGMAAMLICTMLLGSVLISNVYAKGSGSGKSKYNLNEDCKDSHKGKQNTLTGDRHAETSTTTTDTDAKVDKDVHPVKKTIINPDTGLPINVTITNIFKNKNHIEIPEIFNGMTPNGTPKGPIPINHIDEQRIKDKLDYKKTLPLEKN